MPGVVPVFTMGPKRPASGRAVTVLMILGILIGTPFMLAGVTGITRYLEFRNHSVTVDAKITHMEVVDGATNRLTQHLITYTYDADGVEHAATMDVDRTFYSQVAIGSTVTIRHLKTNPGESTITGQGIEGSGWMEGVLVVLFIGTLMILFPVIEIISRIRKVR